MKILDCESIKSAYKSLETILGLKKSDLCQLFDEVNVYKEMRASYCDFLLSCIHKKTNCETNFDKSCFFHATRTWPDNTYEDGLLPTKQALNKIRDFLPSGLGNSGGDADMYVNKCCYGGPFGFLIREFAFVRDSMYVNYFDSPEIVVEDVGIKREYRLKTLRCIVKFVDQLTPTTEAWEPTKALGTALLYAYRTHHSKELARETELTYAFDGGNMTVPYSNIKSVEFLDDDDITCITS